MLKKKNKLRDAVLVALSAAAVGASAADRVIESPRPVSNDWLQQAEKMQLGVAQTIVFQSMVRSDVVDDAGDSMSVSGGSMPISGDSKPVSGDRGARRT